ncbi:MAG: FAD-binding protein [Anaerolineae bacterium]|nr:FAD-binding protein [Anaerolineae bacterium]
MPPMPVSERLADFAAALRPQLAGELRLDPVSRTLYSTDASLYQVMPLGVLLPQTVEDVMAAAVLAHQFQLPLLPRTAGSSLAGQAVNEALVIDFSRYLDAILDFSREERWVRVQPGVVLDDLNEWLRPHRLQFGPDPASSNRAGLGGIVANNSTGSHSIRYGLTVDHLRQMNVLLNDGSSAHLAPLYERQVEQKIGQSGREGEIYRQLAALIRNPTNQAIIRDGTPRHWRRCGGYNLDRFLAHSPDSSLSFHHPPDPRFNVASLICGSEGTLALITDLTLNLVPLPTHTALAVIHFADLPTALQAVPTILETNPSAVELMDHLSLTLCRDVPAYARLLPQFIEGQPHCLLLAEYQGESQAELANQIATLQRQTMGATTVLPLLDAARQKAVWQVRKVSLGLLMSLKGGVKPIPFIEDAAVPVEHLAAYVAGIEQFCQELGTPVTYYAHASAGCLHFRPLINVNQAQEIAKMPLIARHAAALVKNYGGALSSEHGDGRSRSWLNPTFFGPELYQLYQQVKRIFDPDNRLNPGNIVQLAQVGEADSTAPVPLIHSLRVIPSPHPPTPLAAIAVECNGAGVCRKRASGTMCPSFMVTREEEHSTRGRANLLRLFLTTGGEAVSSGQLAVSSLQSSVSSLSISQSLDLCISCKACKAECPSAVDMAWARALFLDQYHAEVGLPWRDWVLGHIGRWSRLSSGRIAPLINRLLTHPITRRLLEKTLALTAQRPLPPFARENYLAWYKRRDTETRQHRDTTILPAPPRPLANSQTRKLALFNDTFTTYNEPHIAIAATELLEAAGFTVIPTGHLDEGRPFVSKGMLKEARAAAAHILGHLVSFAARGIPIIGLEPSSILTLRDEYAALLPGDQRPAFVAPYVYTFEEFLAHLADEKQLALSFDPTPRHILLHGHCHQKALVGTQPAHRTLNLLPNVTVTEVDSGCCGMAGSFGYEVEHLEISRQMGERRLFPAVRAAGEQVWIAAAGTSCRQQIQFGTGRLAHHPAEILRHALTRA